MRRVLRHKALHAELSRWCRDALASAHLVEVAVAVAARSEAAGVGLPVGALRLQLGAFPATVSEGAVAPLRPPSPPYSLSNSKVGSRPGGSDTTTK